ncbi:MAG: rRNA maturation RNase YbeY [Bacteriovoracaceae bacterium]|nr:rRNA maturation RNase YbeY [Bacteriovoracaceae bacterium]
MSHQFSAKKLTISYDTSLKENPFPVVFKKNFEKVVTIFDRFLSDKKQNLFSDKYTIKPFYYFNVSLCGDTKMKRLNTMFRQKNKTTDVLTLALYENIRSGDEFLLNEVELGDILISGPVMKKQAKEYDVTFEQEFFHLLVHGLLHLLGFDHEISDEEEKLMQKLEKKIMDKIFKEIY